MNRIIALFACLTVLVPASTVFAVPTAQFWEELGGSASGDGLSLSTSGVPTGNRHVSVALGPDGRPVVAYADGDTIRVRRWTGTAWEMIGPSGASGGLPQIVTDATGRMYLAWRQFAGATLSWEVFLLARDWNGTAWQALGNSATGGGISGAEGAASVPAFSLVLAPDGTPYVAYQCPTLARTDFAASASGLDLGTQQVFVRYWAGPTQGWLFLGSGREGGGASNALSFRVDGNPTTNFASHGAEHPVMAIGDDGRPIVTFIYTNWFQPGNPAEFNGENDDLYATRWNGTAWEPLGPATPTAPVGAGLGGPGGISNTPGWIREVVHDRLVRQSIMIDRDGTPFLAWGETTAEDGWRRIYVYRWTGAAWVGVSSASGQVDMIAYSYDTSLAQGIDGPLLAWPRGGGDQSWVNVLMYNSHEDRWQEMGTGSASGQGISAPGNGGFNPRLVTTSAGIPTVAWIDTSPAVPQAYLRTFQQQTGPDFSVTSVTAPASAQPGQSFGVSAIVRNGGNAAAPASQLNFYLAAGTERAAGDVPLGSRAVPDLAVGASATLGLTVTVPATTATGSWRILAVVDEADLVVELNELNNTRASSAITVARPAPDLDITAFTAPATVQAGGSLTVQHTVANIGDAAAGAFTLRFFLSTDDVLDAGDTPLGARSFAAGLAAGASSALTTTLTIPATVTAPAAYRVIAMAALDAGTERDTSNNGAVSGVVNVTPRDLPSLPDLTVSDVTVPATVAVGRPLAIRHTIQNVGSAAAGMFTIRFYLSADGALDAGDVLLGSRTQMSLASGATTTMTSTFTIPAATALGTSRILVVADALAQVEERDETNNVGVSAALSVTAFAPDLTITALAVPAAGQTGRPLAITNTVRNVGPAPAGAFTVRFYLSSDDTLDAGDVLLGARTLGSLGVGMSSPAVTTLMIPPATAPANYQVIAVVAAPATQAELDETNNVAVSGTVAIGLYRPDLSVTALTTPAVGQTGRPLAITNTVRNAGPAPASAFTVRFYLSTDGALDAGDVLLGARTLGGLGAGMSSTAVTTLMIPPATAAATYQVIAVADAGEQQAEIEEGNNVAVSAPLSITLYRPDLSMTALALPGSGAVGRPLAVRHTIRNAGPAPAGVFTMRFYLSTDATLDDGDVLLGTRRGGSLGVGASRTETAVFTIPTTTTPGTFFVIAVLDPLNQQAEMDKSNNVTVSAAMPITAYRPDLTLASLTIPATGAVGRPLAITNAVRNVGPAPAGLSSVRFYLSSDGVLDAGDVLLGTRMLGGLGAGATSAAVTSLVIPVGTVPGPYRVIAVADALEQQTELDEANNTRVSDTAVAITLFQPDLVLTALGVPAVGAAGRPLPITHTVRNIGPAPAGAFTVRFYLSADGTFDGGDRLLGARTLGGLAAGASSTAATTVTIPSDTVVPADYRIIAVVDALNQQTELDEDNNITATSAPISIVAFQPDLTLTSVKTAATAAAGRSLVITHMTSNRGMAPTTGPFTISFYLSADATLDAGDVLLGSRTVTSVIAAGASRTDVTTVTVPPGTVVPGSYRVLGVVDALGQQTELDETNNVTASTAVTITAFLPDLTIATVALSAPVIPGRAVTVRETLRNVGPAPTRGAYTLQFYLSADDTPDAGDVLLGSRTLSTVIAAGASRTDATTMVVPAGTRVPSPYRVIAVANGLGQQAELDESNNARASAPLS